MPEPLIQQISSMEPQQEEPEELFLPVGNASPVADPTQPTARPGLCQAGTATAAASCQRLPALLAFAVGAGDAPSPALLPAAAGVCCPGPRALLPPPRLLAVQPAAGAVVAHLCGRGGCPPTLHNLHTLTPTPRLCRAWLGACLDHRVEARPATAAAPAAATAAAATTAAAHADRSTVGDCAAVQGLGLFFEMQDCPTGCPGPTNAATLVPDGPFSAAKCACWGGRGPQCYDPATGECSAACGCVSVSDACWADGCDAGKIDNDSIGWRVMFFLACIPGEYKSFGMSYPDVFCGPSLAA